MGCDIHIECFGKEGDYGLRYLPRPVVATRRHGLWMEEAGDWFAERDYRFFARLAGVRGSLLPIVPPRGMYPGAREAVPAEYNEENYPSPKWHFFGDHSFTWYTAEELLQADYGDARREEWFEFLWFLCRLYERDFRPDQLIIQIGFDS